MNTNFLSSVLSLFILVGGALVASAQNVLLFTFDDSGPNVTATVTGSFDTSGLNFTGRGTPQFPIPAAFIGATGTFYRFGTTTATNIDRFGGANAPGSPLDPLPILIQFPAGLPSDPDIITPLSEYLEINVFLGPAGSSNASIGLAEGEPIFNADTLANNVIVFQPNSLDELGYDFGNGLFGNGSFLSTTPITVLSDPSGENTIQFVLAEIILGDVNQDGVADFFDISPFIDVLKNSSFQAEADTNQDGEVNFFDVASFIEILTGE